jgi:protein-disulfide isomerase
MREIESLKQGQQRVLSELQQVKSALQAIVQQRPTAQGAPTVNVSNVEFSLGENNPVLGLRTARLAVIEFIDYQWPYCARHVRETFPEILKAYVDNGRIRYAVADLPLPIHKLASKAAEASHCAAEQKKYWEMREQMMSRQDRLDNLASYAAQAGIDTVRFEDCLKTNKYSEGIAKDRALARIMKISGVPVFILAKTDPEDPLKFKSISLIGGAQPFSSFQREIDKLLEELRP